MQFSKFCDFTHGVMGGARGFEEHNYENSAQGHLCSPTCQWKWALFSPYMIKVTREQSYAELFLCPLVSSFSSLYSLDPVPIIIFTLLHTP